MRAVLDLAGDHGPGYCLQFGQSIFLAALNGRFACHGVEHIIPRGRRVGGAGDQQLGGQFSQGAFNVGEVHIKGGLAYNERAPSKVLHLKTED